MNVKALERVSELLEHLRKLEKLLEDWSREVLEEKLTYVDERREVLEDIGKTFEYLKNEVKEWIQYFECLREFWKMGLTT